MKADRKRATLAMERAHMTVHDVAKAAGLPPQTTAAIICGMNVQPDTLARIARALDVGLDEIAVGVVAVLKTNGRAGGGSSQGAEPPKLPAGRVRVDTPRFVEAMARSGLTAAQLAKRAGVTPETVRSITRGAEAKKAETVDKLAAARGVAAAAGDLIKREGKA